MSWGSYPIIITTMKLLLGPWFNLLVSPLSQGRIVGFRDGFEFAIQTSLQTNARKQPPASQMVFGTCVRISNINSRTIVCRWKCLSSHYPRAVNNVIHNPVYHVQQCKTARVYVCSGLREEASSLFWSSLSPLWWRGSKAAHARL